MNLTTHHIWCNRRGDPNKCSLCSALFSKYVYDPTKPPKANDLARQHFKHFKPMKGR